MINLRPLVAMDIPNLPQIRPTYRSATILEVEKSGTAIEVGWHLVERQLPQPFDKGARYDFGEAAQSEIRRRLDRPDDTYQRVLETEHEGGSGSGNGENGRLIGLLDLEIQDWNNTALLWNLMIDLDYRRQGLGRRLWHRALDFAQQAEVRAILIETQNTNVDACRFYARMGCQLAGLNEIYYSNDGLRQEVALFWAYRLSQF